MNNHYIYSWSTQEGVPFYIGQGKHNKDYKYARAYHIHYINNTRKPIEWKGVLYNTHKELAIFLGMNETTLDNRLKKGISLDLPINTNKRRSKKIVEVV